MLSCYGIETNSPPSPRIGHSLHYLKKSKEIVLFGGASIEEGTSNDIYIYNLSKNKWTKQKIVYKESNGKLSKIPEPRYEHTGIIIENKDGEEELFIFGGTTGVKLLNDSFIYNFSMYFLFLFIKIKIVFFFFFLKKKNLNYYNIFNKILFIGEILKY